MIDRILTTIAMAIVALVMLSTVWGLGTLFFGGPCPKNPMCFNPFTGQKVLR